MNNTLFLIMGDTVLLHSSYSFEGKGFLDTTPSFSSVSPILFSVPPPSTKQLCSSCSSCGNKVTVDSLSSSSSSLTEEGRTFALQLRAAAIFNKTDVPPPPLPSATQVQLDYQATVSLPSLVPPSSLTTASTTTAQLVSPPSPESSPALPFTMFPPPPITSSYPSLMEGLPCSLPPLYDPQGVVAAVVNTEASTSDACSDLYLASSPGQLDSLALAAYP